MKALKEFTVAFDHDEMILALAAALDRTRIKNEEAETNVDDH